jgi:hypothetical protein
MNSPNKRAVGGHGWLRWNCVERKRKNGSAWTTKQLWFYWEENGQKRSRYVPRKKEGLAIDLVQRSKRPIATTLDWLYGIKQEATP